jgi:transcriptional regulator with XRE-family HTH domain
MVIGERLRLLREEKNLSQGHIEQRTGLIRCYVSRVENGHTIPSLETLEKFARALEVPMYQLFYDGEEPPKPRAIQNAESRDHSGGRASRKIARYMDRFRRLFVRIGAQDQAVLMLMARMMATPARRKQRA